ncbi:hypothetical protein EWM64_g7590 [Hericium alpestre]|uniref:F-box domain-containing protein n=1 Tax=Hericium alpestre TaxID=135208 RepID=A0A4Y9ZNR5_9AGAM|nr:hypothetical protein EWM64_g7590 [Hericium alpestre]
MFTGLQSLFIQHSFRLPDYNREEWAPTLTEFLDALERMPALKELCIEGPLPNYDPDVHSLNPPSNARKVSLLNLEYELQLGGRMHDVALALSRLAISGSIALAFEIMPYDEDGELELQDFFRVVSNHIRPRVRSHIPIEEMHINGHSSFYLSVSPEFGDEHGVYIEFGNSDVDKPSALHHFLEMLPFCPIIRVEISGLEFDRDDWQEAFGDADGNASSIICISIEGGYLEEFCSFLGGPDLALLPVELELPLSDLESLELKEYSFGAPSRRLLLEALQKRKEQEVPLDWVKFTHCSSLDSGWLDTLRDLVPEVEIET